MVFPEANRLKRAYEFFANPKARFTKLTQPHHQKTAQAVSTMPVVLVVGDSTYLDYKGIKSKREGYGPIGNGGNGLILHSSLAVEPDQGQPIGLLWEKLWHREPKVKPPSNEAPEQKKARIAAQGKASRERPFEQKESYRWVEALAAVHKQLKPAKEQLAEPAVMIGAQRQIIHIFDREGDIAEVFEQIRQMECTGVLVRAAHNRSLTVVNAHLWDYMSAQPVQFAQEVKLPGTTKREARTAKLAVSFAQVQLRSPRRLSNQDALAVSAVYAVETAPPEGEEAVCWLLLTTEPVTTAVAAATVLRWYTYRWHVEEYHKILKSGCKAESYRLASTSMETLLGFLTVIAAELLRVTYLHRTQPEAPADRILAPLQLDVLQARADKLPKQLTVAWAVQAVAELGGYLGHRRKTPIGIQVLWRGWLKLASVCEGWELAKT